VGLKSDNAKVYANIQLPGLTIRYRVDDSEPGSKSTPYTGPVSDKGKLRFAAFDTAGRRGKVTEIVNQ
jgi:hexosaminidase